jgi:hypothetical protein
MLYILHIKKGKLIDNCVVDAIMTLLLDGDDANSTAHIVFNINDEERAKAKISEFLRNNSDIDIDDCCVTKTPAKKSDIPGLQQVMGYGFSLFYVPFVRVEQEVCEFW